MPPAGQISTPQPYSAVGALRAEFDRHGLELRTARYPDGHMYGVEVDGLLVYIYDAGRYYFTDQTGPAGWFTEAWETDRNGQLLGDDPLAEVEFRLDEVQRLVGWVLDFLDPVYDEPVVAPPPPAPVFTPAPVPAPAPVAPAQVGAVRPPPVAQPPPQPPAQRAPRGPRPGLPGRGVRPGRYPFESWPPQHNIRVAGPRRVDRGRCWQTLAGRQPIGWVLAEQVPRPGWLRHHRTVWRAYALNDTGLVNDLTFRGRESRRGAIHELVTHWMATQRSLGPGGQR